jgi:8-oxo-dGTP pyrophosphatase MutT (NUDIX family)
MSAGPIRACDHRSVGVILTREDGRMLLIRRALPPIGIAPVAGHLDEHGDDLAAATAEVREEVGLSVGALALVAEGWRPNLCRRPITSGRRPGHQWTVYRGEATGTLIADPRETRVARWVTRGQVATLAARTIAYAHGYVTDARYQASPGLEAVWLQWLLAADLLDPVAAHDIRAVDRVAQQPIGGSQ